MNLKLDRIHNKSLKLGITQPSSIFNRKGELLLKKGGVLSTERDLNHVARHGYTKICDQHITPTVNI